MLSDSVFIGKAGELLASKYLNITACLYMLRKAARWIVTCSGLQPIIICHIYIYTYIGTYVYTYWAVGFGRWLMYLLSNIPLIQYGGWWRNGMLFVAVDKSGYLHSRSVNNYWSVNLERAKIQRSSVMRPFCQPKSAIVDSKVKGTVYQQSYNVGIIATITSSNRAWNANQFSSGDPNSNSSPK